MSYHTLSGKEGSSGSGSGSGSKTGGGGSGWLGSLVNTFGGSSTPPQQQTPPPPPPAGGGFSVPTWAWIAGAAVVGLLVVKKMRSGK